MYHVYAVMTIVDVSIVPYQVTCHPPFVRVYELKLHVTVTMAVRIDWVGTVSSNRLSASPRGEQHLSASSCSTKSQSPRMRNSTRILFLLRHSNTRSSPSGMACPSMATLPMSSPHPDPLDERTTAFYARHSRGVYRGKTTSRLLR